MKNELLTIGPFTVYGYGLMIAIGILAGCLIAEYRAGKQKLDSEQIFPMILWCLVGGFSVQSFSSGSQSGNQLFRIRDL